jgi:hypothetical protein
VQSSYDPEGVARLLGNAIHDLADRLEIAEESRMVAGRVPSRSRRSVGSDVEATPAS